MLSSNVSFPPDSGTLKLAPDIAIVGVKTSPFTFTSVLPDDEDVLFVATTVKVNDRAA